MAEARAAVAERDEALVREPRAWMVKRSVNGNVGGLKLESRGLSVGCEALGLSSRVRRAASRLQVQPEEPVVASCGPPKDGPLTVLARRMRL